MSVRAEPAMGTVVTIHVVRPGAEAAIERAFGWFHEIEERCTRFDERSELMQLTTKIGVPVPASAILFEVVQFALRVAEESGGAFDPTLGGAMQAVGFNREHRTGRIVQATIAPEDGVTFRDVHLDQGRRTITLSRPLILDLGALAKGLAVDAAARELQPFADFVIDAGGDLYFGGHDPEGDTWSAGISHPRIEGRLIDALRVSDQAVCTSGDYERRVEGGGPGHHIRDPRTGASPGALASATVVAPTALLADALATAALVLGPVDGLQLLDRLGVEGLLLSPELERYETEGLRRG